MTSRPTVSIITPAFNAAGTIEQTIRSVLDQTYADWEHIVVDDGSSDGTGEILGRYQISEPRIHPIRQDQKGEAAARNTGLARARGDLLLFLDADDWVGERYLETACGVLDADESCGATVCRSARVAHDGHLVPQKTDDLFEGDLFPILARYPPFHVHACVVRARLVRAAGCFDTSLKRCPDWDLWQRVARMGARFAKLDETFAFYRMSPAGVSLDADQMLCDSLVILGRGHGPDRRVAAPSPAYANGMPIGQMASQVFYLLSWCAGLLLGSGRDARALLDRVGDVRFEDLWAPAVADCILEAAPLPTCNTPAQWALGELSGFSSWLGLFSEALERKSGTAGLAGRVQDEVGRRVEALRIGDAT